MARAFIVVLDSAGIGGAPDAHAFFNGDTPDTGSNTVGHIAEQVSLNLPNLDRLGLGRAIQLASGLDAPGLGAQPQGLWGAATEVSKGKDTPSGHWELAGVPVPWEWHYFPKEDPAFPPEILEELRRHAGTEGTLANTHASGTAVIEEFGEEHIRTGWPICYTSVDSVLQIAAHEEHFGLDRLLTLCQGMAPTLHAMRVGRVIARPFIGTPGSFTRTPHRHDYAIAPPEPTLCDWVSDAGGKVHAVGKIGDIFSMQGIDDVAKGTDTVLMEHLVRLTETAEDGSLTFANFVEFDSLYGHRRDVTGYAAALEWFDAQMPRLFANLQDGDLMIFTADHGNDPTWTGTDHTRERVPVLGWGVGTKPVGHVAFADVGASVAAHLGIPAHGPGTSFL
ncbi:MAG: phosphopentomutase [Alphaproteobacteria bacterium]|nr:phosphopentomutase [Alphaproteobacteria bacterium]